MPIRLSQHSLTLFAVQMMDRSIERDWFTLVPPQ